MAQKFFYQDGADFYDSKSDDLLFHFTGKMLNDYDMAAAEAARKEFLMRFPDYEMEGAA